MKIVVIGAGTVGKYVIEELKQLGEVIVCSRKSAEFSVDVSDKGSIEALFEKIGPCDHVVVVVGKTPIVPFQQATDEQFSQTIATKLMGQINVVRVGMRYLRRGGSFTLTTGYLSRLLVENVTIPAFVNAALERFIVNVALEMKDLFRINAASPAMLEDSLKTYGKEAFQDFPIISGKEVGRAYFELIDSNMTGAVFKVEP